MSLDYKNAYHCHCALALNTGRSIVLKSLTQRMTYGGLMEGSPTAKLNDAFIQRTLYAVKKDPATGGRAPFVIQPARRDYLRAPGDMAAAFQDEMVPEWMPMITCIGVFESAPTAKNRQKQGSTLTIVWFQDEYALPIAPACLNAIKAIDWDAHGFDFEH
jgi:hypothetical protein